MLVVLQAGCSDKTLLESPEFDNLWKLRCDNLNKYPFEKVQM